MSTAFLLAVTILWLLCQSFAAATPIGPIDVTSSSLAFLSNSYVMNTSTMTAPVANGTDKFSICLARFRTGEFGTWGGTDNHGDPVKYTKATALTYPACVKACGSSQVPFSWSLFFNRVSQWLLPWLALVSQLPFGADDKLDNLESVLLTIGSPTLAGYSLALTVLNGRWIARRFAHYQWPNMRDAIRVLTSLQQSPLEVDLTDGLLASLVILPQNDAWWKELVTWLNYTQTWSMSAITSIAWVIIAYVYTVIDSFAGDITVTIPNNGQGVGSIWIWLLPVVIGWLQVSPTCNRLRVREALNRANNFARTATEQGLPVIAERKAISLRIVDDSEIDVHTDEQCTAPIYNYARFFTWTKLVEEASEVFRAASERAEGHESVDGMEWIHGNSINEKNRTGTLCQIKRYSIPRRPKSRLKQSRWGSNAISRMISASIFALILSWGTTGAALVVGWFTYTYGIGCRAGSYIVYGTFSTVSWMLLVASSMLAHMSRPDNIGENYEQEELGKDSESTLPTLSQIPIARNRRRYASWAITTRRIGKVIASFNAIWVLASCLFQFSNFYNQCFCNSSIFSLWDHAYVVISFDGADAAAYKKAWIGGVCLAGSTAFIFTSFVALFVNPTLPD
ncbi:hypothetical protein M422DRAFT_226773 [Sphaerobolus stellatus SS14]|nr:hypothetical protein M422DRAFT_226773 [Sphaerobolus stellatus SS14]